MSLSADHKELLLQLLRGGKVNRISGGPSETQWDKLYRHAELNGVAPLIYWQFRQNPAFIPEKVFHKFRQAYIQTLGRNKILLAELDRVVELLITQQIEVVLFKGAVFARLLYEDLGLRPMSDLDLLVRKQDIPTAGAVLKQAGYEEPVLHQSEGLKKDVTHDVHLRQSKQPYVDIEVHWLLGGGERYRYQPDMTWFWQRVVPLEGWRKGVYTFSPAAHLLYLCAHLGYQHGLGNVGLLWLVDIARFLAKEQKTIDWDDFAEGAKHQTWSAAAYFTLREVQKHFNQAPPETVMEQLHSQMTAEEEQHVMSMSVSAPSRVLLAWKQFQQLERSAQVRNILARSFPSLAFMRQRYGFRSNWQAVLGYPIRWVDLSHVLFKYLWAKVIQRSKR